MEKWDNAYDNTLSDHTRAFLIHGDEVIISVDKDEQISHGLWRGGKKTGPDCCPKLSVKISDIEAYYSAIQEKLDGPFDVSQLDADKERVKELDQYREAHDYIMYFKLKGTQGSRDGKVILPLLYSTYRYKKGGAVLFRVSKAWI